MDTWTDKLSRPLNLNMGRGGRGWGWDSYALWVMSRGFREGAGATLWTAFTVLFGEVLKSNENNRL